MAIIWKNMKKPILALAAMDGVTDASMRHITKKYGSPDFMVTEFTSADGIVHGVSKLLRDFYYTEEQHPIVAQIFGTNTEAFKICSVICCALGFDGIDINMGCPADSVAHKGGGAALIKNPKLAKQLVGAVEEGIEEWVNGRELESLGLPEPFLEVLRSREVKGERERLPISVKTRVGYDKPVTEEWMKTLLETSATLIAMHGRTLEQQYSGEADWEEIAKAARIAHEKGVVLLGNGDINSKEVFERRVRETGVDGVWIGRAAMGNPWIFPECRGASLVVAPRERMEVMIEHCQFFEKLNEKVFKEDRYPFLNMRKHLGWYVKGFPGAAELRAKLYQTNSSEEVIKLVSEMSF